MKIRFYKLRFVQKMIKKAATQCVLMFQNYSSKCYVYDLLYLPLFIKFSIMHFAFYTLGYPSIQIIPLNKTTHNVFSAVSNILLVQCTHWDPWIRIKKEKYFTEYPQPNLCMNFITKCGSIFWPNLSPKSAKSSNVINTQNNWVGI